MTSSPVNRFLVPVLFAGLSVFPMSLAVGAEGDGWPFNEDRHPSEAWPFDRNSPASVNGGGGPAESQPSPGVIPQPMTSGPIQILPPGATNATEAPYEEAGPDDLTLFPSGNATSSRDDPSIRSLGSRPGETGTGIQIGNLAQVDESSAGLLDDRSGGLGAGMWAGTDRIDVERMMGELPGPSTSPVMADLARRLFLTAARPPEGASEGRSLLALRLQRLNAAGRAGDIVQLDARVGGQQMDPYSAVEFAQAYLAVGDVANACAKLDALPVGSDPSLDPAAAFALKLSILCQISAGQSAAANLTADLAREQGLSDPTFFALAAAATDGIDLDAPEPDQIDPLLFALMKLANRPIDADVLTRLAPALLPALAGDDTADIELRISAAEKAASLGLMSGDETAAAYLALPYTLEEVSGVRIGREPASPYRRRALFHQAVLDERVPAGRADLLGALFMREQGSDAYRASLLAHNGSLATVPASSSLSAFAPYAGRAFVELGDRVRASMWLNVIREMSSDALAERQLAALLRLSDPGATLVGSGVPTGEVPIYLADAMADLQKGGAARDFAAVEIVLLDSLGGNFPASVWEQLLSAGDLPTGHVPELALMQRLRNAQGGARRGEVVMLALAALKEAGPAGTHPQPLAEIVEALVTVGLEREARRLAVEALLGRSMTGV